jgi:hypothetical protein
MIHALLNGPQDEDTGLMDYACVGCGAFVTRETVRYLEYLVRTKQGCFCGPCDPLPEEVPAVLRGDGVVLACLLSINSTYQGG